MPIRVSTDIPSASSPGFDSYPADTGSTITGEAITLDRTSALQYSVVMVDIDATSSATRAALDYHDIEVVNDSGEDGNFTALTNSPIWGTSSRFSYGPRTAFAYATPGTKTIQSILFDGTSIKRVTSAELTIEDPDTVFSGTNTAVVSSTSDWTGAPSGASQHTTVSAALSALSGKTNQRLLLQVDETITDRIAIDDNNCERLWVGRYGGSSMSDRPTLDKSSSTLSALVIDGNSYTEIVVEGLNIIGQYDTTQASPHSETTENGDGIAFENDTRTAYKTVANCVITNIPKRSIDCAITDTATPMNNIYLYNTRIIGWGDYAILGGSCTDWAFVGCTIQHPTGTVNGDDGGKDIVWPNHGAIRMTRPYGRTVISNCDLSVFGDWSSSTSNRRFQECLRWNNGGHVTASTYPFLNNSYLVMDRVRTEGGNLNIFTNTNHATVGDNWVIVDRMHSIFTDHPQEAWISPMGGVTFRNCVGVIPNTPPGRRTGTRDIFSDNVDFAYQPGAGDRRSEFYSNGVIDLRSDANATNREGSQTLGHDLGGYTQLSNTYFGANVIYVPNMSSGLGGTSADAPLSTASRYNVLYDGERYETNPVDTTRAYGAEVTASYAPTTGSSAIGGASTKVSLLDYNGNLRQQVVDGLTRSTFSEGPFEPNLES